MRILSILVLMVAALPGAAHEFWISPDTYAVAEGEAMQAELRVGEDFEGPGYAFVPQRFARFEVTRRVNVPVTFTVEKSTNLKDWDDAPFSTLGMSRPGDIDVVVHSIQVDEPVSYPCHYRVRWDLTGS